MQCSILQLNRVIVTEGDYQLRVAFTARARAGAQWHWTTVDQVRGEPGDRRFRSGRAATSDAALRDARDARAAMKLELEEQAA